MKVQNRFCFLIGLILISTGLSLAQQTSVLFIGNSYTYYNGLPLMVENLASSTGDTLTADSHTKGGATLRGHAGNAATYQQIRSNDYDYVVLQAQSQEPSFPLSQVQQQTFPYAKQLADSICAIHPRSRSVFYMTWGRKNGDASNCSSWPPVCTYEGMDSLLNLRYRIMADDNHGFVSPVGAVWRYLRKNHPEIELYNADESHPSAEGSYAAACSFYAILLRKDPTSCTYKGVVSSTNASKIRQAAKVIVYDSLSKWNIGAYEPVANFTYKENNWTITLTNTSKNYDSVYWDFGDGMSSNESSPTHTYKTTGKYRITLKVINNSDQCVPVEDTISLWVNAQPTVSFQPMKESQTLLSYPNPASNVIHIRHWGSSVFKVRITDPSGRVMVDRETSPDVDITSLKPGMYFVSITPGPGPSFQQILIKE